MFERNRVDNTAEPSTVPVELTLAGGEQVKGRMMVPMGKAAADVINNPAPFVEIEAYSGDRSFIAKAQIASLKLIGVPRSPVLVRSRAGEVFDPYAILGLSSEASWDDVRQAWLRLSKAYHPDRYANADLPVEVKDYLDSMARRINAAYAALEVPHRISKQHAAARTAPVYSSPGR